MTSRFSITLVASLLVFLFSLTAHAQVYKWVDADGKVTYSDVPPPKTAAKVETKAFSSSDAPSADMPFAVAEAVRNMPVTFYSAVKCSPCDDARSFLKQNGIPFTEKTVNTNADIAKFAQVTGGQQLPYIQIGRRIKLTGYTQGEWRNNLTLAGYPESNVLPSNYQYSAAQPLAPPADKQNSSNGNQPTPSDQTPPRDPNGFQF